MIGEFSKANFKKKTWVFGSIFLEKKINEGIKERILGETLEGFSTGNSEEISEKMSGGISEEILDCRKESLEELLNVSLVIKNEREKKGIFRALKTKMSVGASYSET